MDDALDWDAVVIGAGAAGMLAAARAAGRGKRTLLLEKNRKYGVKILISGGTRCNLTHHADARGIANAFPKRQGQFLRSALAALPPHTLIEMIEQEGVLTKVEDTGKVFPVSDRAIDVRDAVLGILLRSGCQIRSGTPVRGVVRQSDGFQIELEDKSISTRSVIIACGGQSYPGCGTTGDGYGWARQLGHTIVNPVPALTPIHSPDKWLQALSGVTLPDASLTVADRSDGLENALTSKKASLDTRRGSLLLTHVGLSGPVALDISRTVTLSPHPRQLVVVANFTPQWTYDEALVQLREVTRRDGRRPINSLLAEQVPRRLAMSLLELIEIDPARRLAEFSKRDQSRLVSHLTRCPINIGGTAGFKKAEVTAGGVALNEVHSNTMESKLVPHCYFAGEVLDLDGPIGGYNFQAAFSTGWLAGGCV